MVSQGNLKQIVLALHNYHDAYGRFPPAVIRAKDGRPLYSWRVLLLPYLEKDYLFRQFKLDEPWDSPHNRPLLAERPQIYMAPAEDDEARDASGTFYQVFVGPGAAFEDPQGANLRTDFPDGLANTILVIEAAEPVPWTKPVDLPYQPGTPLPPVGGIFTTKGRFSLFGANRIKGFNAAFGDGSVHWLPASVSEEQLRALVTRNGGEKGDQER